MRMLWISQNLPFPPKTGVLQRNYNLLTEASRFAEIDLVAISKKDILPGFDAELARRELGKLCKNVDVIELPIEASRLRLLGMVALSAFTRLPFSVNWAASDVLRTAIARRLETTSYDLTYLDTISLAQYQPLLGDVPTVLNHHNIESQLFERRIAFEANVLRKAYYRLEASKLSRYEGEECPKFAANFTVSKLDAERLTAIAPAAKTFVVANGVDTRYFSRTAQPIDPNKIVMVSGMNWFPNRDAVMYFLHDIWPVLSRARPETKLQIVGASPPEEVTRAARKDARIDVTGFVDDVRPYMSSAAVYVCPMRDGGGTRLKILDALSMGLPIIATSMAIEGIDIEPERDVLIGDSATEFVKQIDRALADAALRERLSARGRAFVETHFSWPVIGSKLKAECERIAQRRHTQV